MGTLNEMDHADPNTAANVAADAQGDKILTGMLSNMLDVMRGMAQRIDEVMPGTAQEAAQNVGDMVAGIATRTKRAVPNFAAKVAALFKKADRKQDPNITDLRWYERNLLARPWCSYGIRHVL